MELIISGIDFFHKGGPVMYLLLLCSMFVVAIAIERIMYFKAKDPGRSFTRNFVDMLSQGDRDGAASLAGSLVSKKQREGPCMMYLALFFPG